MAEIIEQSAPTMQEFLTAALNFKSPELRLALGQRPTLRVPTPLVKADRAVFNVPAMTSEGMETLLRSIASPAQRRQLRRDGRVRFVYVLEAPCGGRHPPGGRVPRRSQSSQWAHGLVDLPEPVPRFRPVQRNGERSAGMNAPHTELLILSDGRICVHNLTPAMAALLHEFNPLDRSMMDRATMARRQERKRRAKQPNRRTSRKL